MPPEMQDIKAEATRRAPRVEDGDSGDVHSVDYIAGTDWKHLVEQFTEDMDPFDINISLLAERLQRYIEKRQEYALEVPGRVILLAAIVLNMKTVQTFEGSQQQENGYEEDVDWVEDEFFHEVEDADTVGPHVETPPRSVPLPVKRVAKRPVSRSELVDALDKALDIDERRTERQEQREDVDYGIEVKEDDIQDRLSSLFSRLKNLVTGGEEAVQFSQLVNGSNEDKLHRFIEVLHLETEEKVQCKQPEFFADIEIILQEKGGDGSAA